MEGELCEQCSTCIERQSGSDPVGPTGILPVAFKYRSETEVETYRTSKGPPTISLR